jgi:hypothetical protein
MLHKLKNSYNSKNKVCFILGVIYLSQKFSKEALKCN